MSYWWIWVFQKVKNQSSPAFKSLVPFICVFQKDKIQKYPAFESLVPFYHISTIWLFRVASGENWPNIMIACGGGAICDKELAAVKLREPEDQEICGSIFAYLYFVSFVFLCSFLVCSLLFFFFVFFFSMRHSDILFMQNWKNWSQSCLFGNWRTIIRVGGNVTWLIAKERAKQIHSLI